MAAGGYTSVGWLSEFFNGDVDVEVRALTDELKEAKKMVQKLLDLLGDTKEELAPSEWVQNKLWQKVEQSIEVLTNRLKQLKQQPDAANVEEAEEETKQLRLELEGAKKKLKDAKKELVSKLNQGRQSHPAVKVNERSLFSKFGALYQQATSRAV